MAGFEQGDFATAPGARPSRQARLLDRLLRLLVKRRLQRLAQSHETVRLETAERSRRRLERLGRLGGRRPASVRVGHSQLGSLRVETLSPAGEQSPAVIIYLHGGGFIMGSPRTHRALTRWLAAFSGTRVVVPAYRLAPEHPHPAAVEDAVEVYEHLRGEGVDPARIVLVGDSAGGNLVLAGLFALRERGVPLPAGAVCISPWADLSGSGESVVSNRESDAMLPADAVRPAAVTYAGGPDLTRPAVSPLFADFAGLPPLLLHACDCEILLDDARRVAAKARAAGVTVDLRIWHGLPHVFHAFVDFVPEAREALREIAAFVRRVTASDTP